MYVKPRSGGIPNPIMIGFISGNIIEKFSRQLLIERRGIGYRVFVTEEIFEKSKTGEEIKLFIHTAVREDDISLYGFPTKETLLFFELLLTVTRVGPKLALDIMNVSLPRLKNAISKKDIVFLASIPGVGRKTAERVIVELKEKVSGDIEIDGQTKEVSDDVIQALMKLGFERSRVIGILKKASQEAKNDEELIKYFLKNA